MMIRSGVNTVTHFSPSEVTAIVTKSFCSGNSNSTPQYSCPICSATFNRKDNLKSHTFKCCGDKTAKHSSPYRRSPCLYTKKIFICLIDTKHLEFASIDLFHEWKEQEEEATFSYYCQKKGQRNATIKHFYCQHDGTGKCHSERKTTRRNSKGRIKVGHFCIAKMKVWKAEDGMSKVDYYPTLNHICKAEDFHQQPLTES
ncbi:Zinc finger protein WIP2 [Frankliniella fusca]|uniref:Zinc finger protein WIP2 n=1 Tax=Frankliniella fusca TaxID=407009 RepID=A0AAE1LLM4_9NEOP|nr:Zinc finger protein WIP2 [Frankliniella fusca]